MLARVAMIDIKLEIVYKTINKEGNQAAADIAETPELIKEVPVEVSKDGDIVLAHIVAHLRSLGYKLDEAEIWFYSKDYNDYVYCETEPISRIILVKRSDLENNRLRVRARIKKFKSDASTKGTDESKTKEYPSGLRVKERELVAVSYTHLTLPTICSV
eukprot:TRINITY_DN9338_c0_g3_i5.p1 TRINITY_DN9338_c0_g3~~TRINITY_DN9338_c0_g3_i5.p1  ORF type:complete len:159 (-),score=46.86 TRINITY_DN9338_c0_g3_i5:35-511(-)